MEEIKNQENKYNEISQEIYGFDYDSVNINPFQRCRIRKIYDERQGYFWVNGKLKKIKGVK
jgi:hypothetical protein